MCGVDPERRLRCGTWMGDRHCRPWQGVENVFLLSALSIAFERTFSSMDVQEVGREG